MTVREWLECFVRGYGNEAADTGSDYVRLTVCPQEAAAVSEVLRVTAGGYSPETIRAALDSEVKLHGEG